MSEAQNDPAHFMWAWAKTRTRGAISYVAVSSLLVSAIACLWLLLELNMDIRPMPPSVIAIGCIPIIFIAADAAASRFPIARWIALLIAIILLFVLVPRLILFPSSDLLAAYAIGGALVGGAFGMWAYRSSERRFLRLQTEGVAIPTAAPREAPAQSRYRLFFLVGAVAAAGILLFRVYFQ